MFYKSFKIRKLLKTQLVILLTSSLSGIFANNYAEATILNNSYKEVIDHVWQIVYRDFLDKNSFLKSIQLDFSNFPFESRYSLYTICQT